MELEEKQLNNQIIQLNNEPQIIDKFNEVLNKMTLNGCNNLRQVKLFNLYVKHDYPQYHKIVSNYWLHESFFKGIDIKNMHKSYACYRNSPLGQFDKNLERSMRMFEMPKFSSNNLKFVKDNGYENWYYQDYNLKTKKFFIRLATLTDWQKAFKLSNHMNTNNIYKN